MTVMANVTPSFKMLPNFLSECFCLFPLFCHSNVFFSLHLQLSQTLSSSYAIRVFSSPWHVSIVHHCQTRKQQRQRTKNCFFHAFSLCLIHFGRGASLIQENIPFCCIDSQPPTGRERPRPRAVIDSAVSLKHRCRDRNIDCWLKPKSITLTQTAAAPCVFPRGSCDSQHEESTPLHCSPFVNTGTSVCVKKQTIDLIIDFSRSRWQLP